MNPLFRHWLCYVTILWFVDVQVTNARTLYNNKWVSQTDPLDKYLMERKLILEKERNESIGGQLVLDTKEQSVNKILMLKKNDEVMNSLKGGKPYPPSLHFFHAKPLITKSDVFKIIQMMPKGGALHLHDVSVSGGDWLVKNVTYRENCYMCSKSGSRVQFVFSDKTPQIPDCEPWALVKEKRYKSGNPALFDQWLYNNLSLIVSDPVKAYPSENVVWKEFESALIVAKGLVWYRPVLRDYVYECLQQYNDDNVQYLEIRTTMSQTYELDGSLNPELMTLEIYRNVSRQFVIDQKGSFTGAKMIYSDIRNNECSEIATGLEKATGWWKSFPDFMAGYDLVGQEDKGHSLLDCIKTLLRSGSEGPMMPYFFHAGETNWQGTSVDENLIDAILLNTTRIGHGYALLKHLWALGEVKARGIAVEVNPISNQVLKLVDDLRNHPATVFLDSRLPVVISSDDGGVWGSDGLSYDFYQAFMGLSGLTSDLTLLKQLAINSIQYSAMSEKEKESAAKLWSAKWDKFLDDVLQKFA